MVQEVVGRVQKLNDFSIKSDGRMFINGVELKGVKEYKLVSSVESPNTTELTVKMDVRIGQVASEPEK